MIQEYNQRDEAPPPRIPSRVHEDEDQSPPGPDADGPPTPNNINKDNPPENGSGTNPKIKRTPKALYKIPTSEETPLLGDGASADRVKAADLSAPEADTLDSGSRIVTVAIYINMAANVSLLAGKIVVMVLTSSLSVLASLVDAALDFLSTAIVWTTTLLIAHRDQQRYPVGRRRLEPIGVLVFSVVMITAFVQVALQCLGSLTSGKRDVVRLTLPAVLIMAGTVVVKAGCWLWCRMIRNSSVQALAQDAMTDVVFNVFSIVFPLGEGGIFFGVFWLCDGFLWPPSLSLSLSLSICLSLFLFPPLSAPVSLPL